MKYRKELHFLKDCSAITFSRYIKYLVANLIRGHFILFKQKDT